MGRSRPREPADLLEPRHRPTLEELHAAIHEVNPTDRGLPPAEAGRRYALKARLQSLLVRRFAHALTVDDEADGVVVLRHIGGERDFGHAVLAQLDDEARSWVRRKLDTPSSPAVADAPRDEARPRSGAAGHLAEAERLLEAYDYDGARSLLEAAHAAGDVAATRRLVELLVDTLADDEAALRLIPDGAEAGVRARLAVAAARQGDEARAVRLCDGVSVKEAAEARRILAEAAIRAGDLDRAERLLARAREGEPGLYGLDAAAAALSAARRARAAPLVAELSRVRGDTDRAVALARDIVAIDAEEPTARAVLREAAAGRRAERRDALLAEAAGAEATGDLARARDRYEQAAALGADVAGALARLADRAAERRVADAVRDLEQAFARSRRDGVVAWLNADAPTRGRAPADPALVWLAGAARAGGRRAEELADAALAAEGAARALDGGAPDAAAATLEPHREAVATLHGGRALLQRAHAEVSAERRRRARAALADAAGRVASDPSAAARAVAALDPALLDPDERALADAITGEAREALGRFALAAEVETFHASDPCRARRAALELAGRTSGVEREGWLDRAEALRAHIARAFRVTVWETPGTDPRDYALDEAERVGAWLTGDGGIVLVSSRVHQIVVRIADLATGSLRRVVHAVTPGVVDRPTHGVAGDSVWIGGRQPRLLHLALDGEVRGWWDLSAHLPAGHHFLGLLALPDARVVWMLSATGTSREDSRTHAHVVDLDRHVVVRRLTGVFEEDELQGADGVVGGVRSGRGLALFHPDGRPLPRWEERWLPQARSFAAHPARPGAFVALIDPVILDPGLPASIGWVELVADDDAPPPEARWIEQTSFREASALAISRRERAVFLTARGPLTVVCGLVAGAGGDLEEAWTVATSHPTCLARDRGADEVVAIWPSSRGPAWERLGRAAPRLADGVTTDDVLVPDLTVDGCAGIPRSLQSRELQASTLAALLVVDPSERAERIRSAVGTGADPESVLAALAANRTLRVLDTETLVATAARRFPSDPGITLLAAEADGRSGRWEDVAARLRALAAAGVPDDFHEHLQHLLGLAAWHLGARAEARAAWLRAAGGTRCHARALAELAGAHLGETNERTLVGRLARAIADADRLLAAGDPVGAIERLDAPAIWIARERQSGARRAVAWLERTVEPGTADALRRVCALTAYRLMMQGAEHQRVHDLAVPGAWPRARLDEIDAAVARSLDEPVEYVVYTYSTEDGPEA